MKKILIVDAINFLFRSYYAIAAMTNSKGAPSGALFGFIRSIQKLLADFSPDYMAIVFDGPDNKAGRRKLYPDYKKNRIAVPQDLLAQFKLAEQFCHLFGLGVIFERGVEADDAMASIAKWSETKELQVYLCTTDKDLYQLVSPHIFGLNTFKNNLILDEKKVKEIYGVEPSQILDLLAIMGDASDNIPGLPGFGAKTATDLLNQFDSLDNLLTHPELIANKKKQAVFIENKELALLSRRLATLNFDVLFPKELSFFEIHKPKATELAEFYRENDFRSFLEQMQPEKTNAPEKNNYHTVQTAHDLEKLIEKLKKAKSVCIDTETTSLDFMQAQPVGIGFAWEPHEAYYLPLNGKLDQKTIIETIKPLLENAQIGFYGHNIKYDYHVLLNAGIEIRNIEFDTMVASYVQNPQSRAHGLDALSLLKFQKRKILIEDLIGKGKNQLTMNVVPIEKVAPYCCEDVDYTCRLKQLFEKELKENHLDKLFYDIEMPLLPILAKMERAGIFLNEDKMAAAAEHLETAIKLLEKHIYAACSETFNINSPKQLAEILYDKMGLTLPGKKSRSTAADILEKLSATSPLVRDILDYRGKQKLLTTYAIALPRQINIITGRIHPSFNQSVTATGRLSCHAPNLQNIPVRSNEGLQIRKAFGPQKRGWSYLGADYSQIELRLLAHFSNDQKLLEAFSKNLDIHSATAAEVFDVPLDKVTKEMRSLAKTVNFAILYGQGPYGLSAQLNISTAKAKEFIENYFEKYPQISHFLEKCKKDAAEKGYAETLFGRKRPILEITSSNYMLKSAAERLAINTPLQGTAADLIKMAMIAIDNDLRSQHLEGFLILQIHDELIFEIPDGEIETFKKIVKHRMETAAKLKAPLVVDIAIGKNWGEC